MREKRRKIWIDRFQTRLFFRILCYFVLYQAFVWLVLISEDAILYAFRGPAAEPPALSFVFVRATFLVTVSGLFIWDAIKYAHRVVGPLYRFRRTVQAITAGEAVDLVRLRKGDFLLELQDEFNEMMKVLEQRGALVVKDPRAHQDKGQPVSV